MIEERDAMTVFSISGPAATAETNTGTKAFVFTVTPSAAPTGTAATVDWILNLTAGAGQAEAADLASALTATTLNFAVGDGAARLVTVLVNGDSAFEADEAFEVKLQNATNATVSGVASSAGRRRSRTTTPG